VAGVLATTDVAQALASRLDTHAEPDLYCA
jgi:hypothetical protein